MIKYSKFEEEIEKKGNLTFTNVGVSMFPLIRQKKDLIHIKKYSGRLKKYDVPLYKLSNGKYVLHRIIKVREKDYIICGDNCTTKEYGITDKEIIGVLTGITKNGKYISVKDKKYLAYVHLWCDFLKIRIFILKLIKNLKKYIKFILNRR